jgi:hypothetical protein
VTPKISLLPNLSQETKKKEEEVQTLAANRTDLNQQSLADNPAVMQRILGPAEVLPPLIVKAVDQDSRKRI